MAILPDETNYIRIAFSDDDQKSKSNPTPQQRAVYNFHEARHSNEAEDIYASTWFDRTKGFQEHARPTNQSTFLKSWEMIEDLEFGEFFLAHPVAGYSLWQFLQACYELDAAVCGLSPSRSWRNLKPFVYLQRGEIKSTWSNSLQRLKREIEKGVLQGEALLQKFYTIFNGVEKLDNVSRTLDETFIGSLEGKIFADQMMTKICTAYDWRRQKIAELTLTDESTTTSQSDDEFQGDEDMTGSKELKLKTKMQLRGRNKSRGKKNKRAAAKKQEDPRQLPSTEVSPQPSSWGSWPSRPSWRPSELFAESMLVVAIACALYLIGTKISDK